VRMGIWCFSSVPARMVEATLTQFALRGEPAIGCRRTHGKQLPSALLPKVELFMPQKSPRAREGEREGAVWCRCGWRRARAGTVRVALLALTPEDVDALAFAAPLLHG
jgi:hypothetical protein